MVHLAEKTLKAIDDAMMRDGGAAFRMWSGKIIPHMKDAFRSEEESARTHLGASQIGEECARKLWYGFHWIGSNFSEVLSDEDIRKAMRMQRLWNRGHIEEARFMALLLMIGIRVIQQDKNGKQLRFSMHHGHYSGSMDGIGIGVPDLPEGSLCNLEFKTYNDKRFKELSEKSKNGVKDSDWKYYVQCQQYMGKHNLKYTLFMAVNKNDDTLYAEIIPFDKEVTEQHYDRAEKIVFAENPPLKLKNASPGYYLCRFCDYTNVCHFKANVAKNCRTCKWSRAVRQEDENGKGVWECLRNKTYLTKEEQLNGCDNWERHAYI